MHHQKACKKPVELLLPQALLSDVLLQAGYLLAGELDSTSESEISLFSGVIRSGAGCIIHAGGAGGFTLWHG